MTPINYTYSILQYRHSQSLGEVLNIGILVYVPEVNRLAFVYPNKLIRLKFTYPDITSERVIKNYLISFQNKTNEFNLRPSIFSKYNLENSLDIFTNVELLPPDASSLQFTQSKRGITYEEDYNTIIKELYNFYLLAFDTTGHTDKVNDESVLLSKYKRLLRELSNESRRNNDSIKESNKIFYDYKLRINEEKEFTFDMAWQNGSTNLVKPVSFDLARKDSIVNKAYRFFGQFTDIDSFAKQNGFQFDVIVSRPHVKDLFKAYDTALDLISKPDQVRIIEERDLPSYSRKTFDAITTNED